jgi:hypothetical protein
MNDAASLKAEHGDHRAEVRCPCGQQDVYLRHDPQPLAGHNLLVLYRPAASRYPSSVRRMAGGRSTGAGCTLQRLADPALLRLAGEAVLEPVQATAKDVFGGWFAARFHVVAVHPHGG